MIKDLQMNVPQTYCPFGLEGFLPSLIVSKQAGH